MPDQLGRRCGKYLSANQDQAFFEGLARQPRGAGSGCTNVPLVTRRLAYFIRKIERDDLRCGAKPCQSDSAGGKTADEGNSGPATNAFF
jgi:hypothetical protein